MPFCCLLVSYETLASKSAVERGKRHKGSPSIACGDAGQPHRSTMRNKVAAATAIVLALVLLRRHRQQAATTHRRDLAHVTFEVKLLEKQLELAQLEADAARAYDARAREFLGRLRPRRVLVQEQDARGARGGAAREGGEEGGEGAGAGGRRGEERGG